MQHQNCPKPEALFEYLSIPTEVPAWKRGLTRFHLWKCEGCQARAKALQAKWDAYFRPEPDVTSSLIRVYSKLQQDQTLILKGWKLGGFQTKRSARQVLINQGWLFRGGVTAAAAALLIVFVSSQVELEKDQKDAKVAQNYEQLASRTQVPYAQIRIEDKNSVKVHYVQPELLQSIEFETTSTR